MIPWYHYRDLQRALEHWQEFERQRLLAPFPSDNLLEAVRRHQSIEKYLTLPITEAVMDAVKRHESLLKAEFFQPAAMQTADALIKKHAELASQAAQLSERWEREFASVVRNSITAETQLGLDRIAKQVAAQSDLSRLYSIILNRNLTDTLNDLRAAFERSAVSDLQVQSDGSVVVDGEVITAEDLQEAIAPILDEPADFFRNLEDRLASFSKPLHAAVAWLLERISFETVLTVLLFISQEHSGAIKHKELQQMILQAQERTGCEYRVVAKQLAPRLSRQWRRITHPVKMRSDPSAKAATVDSLPEDAIVWFIEKQRQWVRIETFCLKPTLCKPVGSTANIYAALID